MTQTADLEFSGPIVRTESGRPLPQLLDLLENFERRERAWRSADTSVIELTVYFILLTDMFLFNSILVD